MIVEKRVHISEERADYLSRMARANFLSEDQIIEKVLDILFSLSDLLDARVEKQGWSFLSERSLQRIWDNPEDAVYDNWRDIYGVSTG